MRYEQARSRCCPENDSASSIGLAWTKRPHLTFEIKPKATQETGSSQMRLVRRLFCAFPTVIWPLNESEEEESPTETL